MHGHFVWIIVTVALEEHSSATACNVYFSKDLKKLMHLIVLSNGWPRFV